MKKSIIFIFVLFVIIAAETWALYHHTRHPSPVEYAFDVKEYALPKPNLEGIHPFLFETGWADEVSDTLDKIQDVVGGRPQDKFSPSPHQLSEQEQYPADVSQNSEKSSPDTESKTPDTNMPEPQALHADSKALVAVVIDDVGLSVPFTNQLVQIEKPVTVAFLPYGAADKKQVMKLKNAGFEVMLHTPMMPHVKASLAPVTLSPQMSHDEIQQKFGAMLERFAGTGMVGANNHMGSMFTEDTAAMSAVLEILKKNNMFFLDSKTSSKSVAKTVCRQYGVPYIARDIFLDNEKDYGKIKQQFAATERIAQKRGYAVAIGHPYKQTLQALKDWEKDLDAHGVKLVPLSYLVHRF